MKESEKSCSQYVWNPQTGITEIETPWKELSASEIPSICSMWREQRERLHGTQKLSAFTERLSREWAIETGIIENLYVIERGVTQTLIERGFQAEFLTHGSTNKPTAYVLNLLRDQQDALEGVFDFVTGKRTLSTSYVKELHAALVKSQDTTEGIDQNGKSIDVKLIKGDWKIQPNYPTRDGVIFTYCPPEQVSSEMDRLLSMHRTHMSEGVAPEVEAAWLHHRFSQIHPFQDGNGRVCRALASLVLVQAGLFPLIVTRDDKDIYLSALESADKGNLKYLVDLFVKLQRNQFIKAAALAENVISAGTGVKSMLEGLKVKLKKDQQTKEEERYRVFDLSKVIENDTFDKMDSISSDLHSIMRSLSPTNGDAFVRRSDDTTNHFYKGQIVENARNHLGYYADTRSYRAWVALNLYWQRKAHLVFTFHGIGQEFNGTLVCAPFLEFRDVDNDVQSHATLFPVAQEAFIFFHNEDPEKLRVRYGRWMEQSLEIAISQLSESY